MEALSCPPDHHQDSTCHDAGKSASTRITKTTSGPVWKLGGIACLSFSASNLECSAWYAEAMSVEDFVPVPATLVRNTALGSDSTSSKLLLWTGVFCLI